MRLNLSLPNSYPGKVQRRVPPEAKKPLIPIRKCEFFERACEDHIEPQKGPIDFCSLSVLSSKPLHRSRTRPMIVLRRKAEIPPRDQPDGARLSDEQRIDWLRLIRSD